MILFVNKENTHLTNIPLYQRDSLSYLSPKNAVDHDYHKTLQRIKHGKKYLKQYGAFVCHGQNCRHPRQSQKGQHHAGTPKGRPVERQREQHYVAACHAPGNNQPPFNKAFLDVVPRPLTWKP